MDYQTIKYEKVDHVATITLNRPERRNASNSVMNDELKAAWKDFRDDDALVSIITGAGDKAFCAGWDLEDAAANNFEFTDYESTARISTIVKAIAAVPSGPTSSSRLSPP